MLLKYVTTKALTSMILAGWLTGKRVCAGEVLRTREFLRVSVLDDTFPKLEARDALAFSIEQEPLAQKKEVQLHLNLVTRVAELKLIGSNAWVMAVSFWSRDGDRAQDQELDDEVECVNVDVDEIERIPSWPL